MEKEQKINPLDVALKQVDRAAKHLNLDPGLIEKVKRTKRELTVHFPVKMEDGSGEHSFRGGQGGGSATRERCPGGN